MLPLDGMLIYFECDWERDMLRRSGSMSLLCLGGKPTLNHLPDENFESLETDTE